MLLFFDNNRQSFEAFFHIFGDFVFLGDELHDTGKPFLEKVDVHIFGAPREEEVDFDAMTLFEPFRCLFCLQFEVVVARADFDLERLDFDCVGLGFCQLDLLILVVLKFTIIHDFCNRRGGRWRNFNEIEACILGAGQCLLEADDAEIFSRHGDDAQLRGVNLVIYANFLVNTQIGMA